MRSPAQGGIWRPQATLSPNHLSSDHFSSWSRAFGRFACDLEKPPPRAGTHTSSCHVISITGGPMCHSWQGMGPQAPSNTASTSPGYGLRP